MKEEQINPFEYNYEEGVGVEVPGWWLHATISFLKTLRESETQIGFSETYSSSAKEVKEGDLIVEVQTEDSNYPTMNSFMNQKPKQFLSGTGIAAMDLLNTALNAHLKGIGEGKAKKQGTFETKTEENGTPLKLA